MIAGASASLLGGRDRRWTLEFSSWTVESALAVGDEETRAESLRTSSRGKGRRLFRNVDGFKLWDDFGLRRSCSHLRAGGASGAPSDVRGRSESWSSGSVGTLACAWSSPSPLMTASAASVTRTTAAYAVLGMWAKDLRGCEACKRAGVGGLDGGDQGRSGWWWE